MSLQPDVLRGTTIVGTGMYVPDEVVTNRDLERIVETSDEWIVERTGIRERRRAAPEQATSDLALIAAQRALAMAKVDAKDIDQIILATTTPDRILPSCACTLQKQLGAKNAAAYDMFAACTGFIFGMGMARGLISGRMAETVLVIGAETLTRIVDYRDRNTCVLFGDGAGAAVFQACEPGLGIHAVDMHSDGELGEVLEVPAGISRNPASAATVHAGEHYIHMQGKRLFPFAVRSMEDATRKCVERAGWTPEELALFIPHQANLRIIEGVRERLGLPVERVYVNIDRYGNTSSASIAIALDEVVRAGRVKLGDKLAFAAFGGGATWGATTLTWTLPAFTTATGAAAAAQGASA